MALPLTCYTASDKLLTLSGPQCERLCDVEYSSTSPTEPQRDRIVNVCKAQCAVHRMLYTGANYIDHLLGAGCGATPLTAFLSFLHCRPLPVM